MNLAIDLFGKTLKNPILPASGCFACGREAAQYSEIDHWGGLISTGITLEARLGNPGERVVETASGLLNSVGLQNAGIEHFLQFDLPFMLAHHDRVIVNIAGNRSEDYVQLCEKLNGSGIFAIEVNLSCPNVKHGGMALGTHAELVEATIRACREVTDLPLIAKLTPNVTDIAVIAQAAERGGAQAISLVNTFLGMAVDLRTRRPVLRNNTGGLSGPCIKPLALRMCHSVYRAVKVPVIGLGGIQSADDVLEFMLAGARVVQIGSANFAHPYLIDEILETLPQLCEKYHIHAWDDWIGALESWKS